MKREIYLVMIPIFLFYPLISCGPQHQPTSSNNPKDKISIDEYEQITSNEKQDQLVFLENSGPAISFDEQIYYRITSQITGAEHSLSILDESQNNSVNLEETSNFKRQAWKIKSLGKGYFRLTNQWKGKGKSLDVYKNKEIEKRLKLESTNNNAGQAWKIHPVGNGYYRFTTQLIGEDRSLDVVDNGENNSVRLMETGDYAGQLWKIAEFK